MTKEEGIILSAYTGYLLVDNFGDVHEFVEKLLGRPVWTHQLADPAIHEEIRRECKPLLPAVSEEVNRWIPVTERLPDKEFWEHQKLFEDEDLEVQVMIKGAKRATTLLYNAEGEFYEMNADGPTFYLVTHWAPLMEPPKEGV